MTNVTAIRTEATQPPAGGKPPRPPKMKYQQLRDNTAEADEFTTTDVILGLRGVCCALDRIAPTGDPADLNLITNLTAAGAVLSAILTNRID